MNLQDILLKMMRFCAYQERCESDIQKRLSRYQLSWEETQQIIKRLKEENYISEQRYADAFVRGKFRQNKWGKIKIEQGLRQKKIADKWIISSLENIDLQEYKENCKYLAKGKWERIQRGNGFEKGQKTATFLMGKGYEPDIFWPVIEELKNS